MLRKYRKVRIEYFKFESDGDNMRLKEFVQSFKARKFFVHIWFDYLHYDFDHEKYDKEEGKILKQIDEMIANTNFRDWRIGNTIFCLEDKVLVAFYIKEYEL